MNDWEKNLVQPVMRCAEHHPLVFLEILARLAERNPEAIPLFADAMEGMGRWYQAQAAGLEGITDLRRIADGGKGGAA